MPLDDPLPLSAMTAEQQARLLTRRPVRGGDAVEIGDIDRGRAVRRRAVRVIVGVAVFLLAAWACEQLAGSFRVALIVVGATAAAMLLMGRVSEGPGRPDRLMATTWDNFERYKQRGLDARRAGQWDSAKVYLLEAARSMIELSKTGQTEDLRQARRETAARLYELAKDCDGAKATRRQPPSAGRNPAATEPAEPGETQASDWVVKERPTARFSDIAGLDAVKEEIRLKMVYPFEHADLAEKFGIRAGGGILLYGPPGTGKTLLARATAGELDATFFRISAADVLSKWVGEAEQNVKKLFDAAAAEPRAVIFIDEIESLVPARRDDGGGGGVMQRVVPQVLQGMEGFDKSKKSRVLFLGATNVPWQLDPAVLRPGRFDEKVYVPLPDLAGRRQMLDLYLAKRPLAADVDLDAVARQLTGYSGADIKHLCDRAALVPFLQAAKTGDGAVITAAVLSDALHEAQPSVDAIAVQRFETWAANG